MKFKSRRITIFGLILFLALSSAVTAQNLLAFMQGQPEIVSIEPITGNQFFERTYVIQIRQPINHQDTTDGFFLQRVFVADKNQEQPVVFITEGYDANYAANPQYINELSKYLEANQICVEHRYFGESVPDSESWQFLTVENSAEDHHRIVQLFKEYYHAKWLNTGISKGGQTALAHRAFFPNDVSATVAYVAPLNFGVEDGRHENFLQRVGAESCRNQIIDFQRGVLKQRNKMIPFLKSYAKERNYTFPMSFDEVLDFVVLEYSFSFWQWGHACNEIPTDTASAEKRFNYLISISPPDYFSFEGSAHYRPFFYQAASELGYYGYDIDPFADLMSIKTTKGYVNRYMLPRESSASYDGTTSILVKTYLERKARNVVLIYGEVDPWTASAANVRKRGNNQRIVLDNGNHKTRIGALSEKRKKKVIKDLNKMLN